MSTSTRKSVTKRDAERVLNAIREAFPAYCYRYDDDGKRGDLDPTVDQPKIYEPGFHDTGWTIAWEGGPYAWTLLFPYGGIDEEMTAMARAFGSEQVSRVDDVSHLVPDHVLVEPANHWLIGLYVH